MAISITRYVNISSSVGGSAAVARRQLTGRIFTQSQLVPTDSFITFTNATDVGNWFGISSPEYLRAVYYFGWISKNGIIPDSIDYARYNATDTFPQIFGNIQEQNVDDYNSITTGSFQLQLGSITHSFSSLNFTSVVTLADVASVVQTAINAAGSFTLTGTTNGTTLVDMASTAGLAVGMSVDAADITHGTTILSIVPNTSITLSQAATGSNVDETITFNLAMWGLATVSYDSVRGSFNLQGGDNSAPAVILVSPTGSGQDVSNLLGWVAGPTLIVSNGAAGQSPVQAVQASAQASNNFGSFLFIDALAQDDIVDVAAWVNSINVVYMYLVPVPDLATAATYSGLLINLGGTGITLAPLTTEYPEQFPMMIMAATDYTQQNSVQNYMFQMSNLTASVSDDATANILDNERVNYYGVTQTAGNYLAFYQRGAMMGSSSAPQYMNIYANEIWFKDAIQADLMNLLVTQPEVSANNEGQSQILAVVQSVVDEATVNGTISVGKQLTQTQKAFITTATGDQNAWYQVQTIGYWLDCNIVPYNPFPNVTEYKAVYTLIYSKDDVINLITGQQILI